MIKDKESAKNIREKKSKFINAISLCLSSIEAHDLPKVCSSYDLKNGHENEACSSKYKYIESRIDSKNLDDLIVLANRIIRDYEGLELENLLLLEKELNLAKKITDLTLLDLIDYLDKITLYGRLTPKDFLAKVKKQNIVCSTEKMLSIDSINRERHYGEYCWFYSDENDQWHYLNNSRLIKEVLELNKLPQSKVFSFFELLVSPELRQEQDAINLASKINEFISQDDFLLKKVDTISNKPIFKICESSSKIISQSFGNKIDAKTDISSQFITEHIVDCKKFIEQKKYYDAISDARSLVESVFEHILQKHNVCFEDCSGDLPKLFKKIKEILHFESQNIKTKVKNEPLQKAFIKISGSLEQIVHCLATISNNMSKRHSRSSEAFEHHALLAVNCAYTLCNFVFDSYEYQNKNII